MIQVLCPTSSLSLSLNNVLTRVTYENLDDGDVAKNKFEEKTILTFES